jgi:hypothetical protein
MAFCDLSSSCHHDFANFERGVIQGIRGLYQFEQRGPPMNSMRVLLPVLSFLFLVITRPAVAQWDPEATASMGQAMGRMNLMIGNLNLGRAELRRQSHPGAGQTPKADLTFVASPAVAAEFRKNFVANVVRRDPAEEAKIRAEFAHTDVDDVFARALRGQGLSPNNLADVLAANLAIAWKIVNDAPDPSAAAMHGLSARVAANLAGNPAVVRGSDRDKQLLVESLAYQTVFAARSATSAQAAGNTTALASLRQGLIDRFRTMNVNLTALRLTDAGFEPK